MDAVPETEIPESHAPEEEVAGEHSLEIIAVADGARLDLFLSGLPEAKLSRTHAQRLIRAGAVSLNGAPAKQSRKVRAGDRVAVAFPPLEPDDVIPEAIPLDVLYEDGDLLIVNKPKGMAVHPAPHLSSGTLVNALLQHCGDSLSGINGVLRPGIVHRLDKDTSGIIIVAKNDAAHVSLAAQIKERSIVKKYTAVVHGRVKNESGKIESLIGRCPRDRKKMAVVVKHGKEALTEYRVAERFAHFTTLDILLHTGRTHQIRVHAAHIGHPVAGDLVYGGAKLRDGGFSPAYRVKFQSALDRLRGQALHSREIAFEHPRDGRRISFSAPLPDDIMDFLIFIRKNDTE